jgi:hypothetical protein
MAKLHQAVVPDRAPGYANRSRRDLRSHLKLPRRARASPFPAASGQTVVAMHRSRQDDFRQGGRDGEYTEQPDALS